MKMKLPKSANQQAIAFLTFLILVQLSFRIHGYGLLLQRRLVEVVKLGKELLRCRVHLLDTRRAANEHEVSVYNSMLRLLGNFIVCHHEAMALRLRKVAPNLGEVFCIWLRL